MDKSNILVSRCTQVVDPDFSIYTASLPYAVRRALSPQTSRGARKLRDALLTPDGQFRWSRLHEVLAMVRLPSPAPLPASPLALYASLPLPCNARRWKLTCSLRRGGRIVPPLS
jgi:hypothetical protein